MAERFWIGVGEGQISKDGRFLIQKIRVDTGKNVTSHWALYGKVLTDAAHPPWAWSSKPLLVARSKKECQVHAVDSGYEPPTVKAEQPERTQMGHQCPECLVRFEPGTDYKWGRYCGKNCAEASLEALKELLDGGAVMHDLGGQVLRVRAAAPNEPDFVPHPTPKKASK